MDAAVLNGEMRARPRATWTRPKRPWVDPEKDSRAAAMNVAAGFASPQDIIERSGADPQELLEELRQWRDMVAAHGLRLSIDYSEDPDDA